ncbi:hypothetical protein CEG15_12430 [Vibrio anguillarum]|uniref:hypothetical protein n=1 Tax=Vibrio anguillarum TaxID=55601 RepID=UPI000B5424DC|nr:hypothetical protein [Vibrio anguillarum]ASG00938.1 hypothetical protein CEG15_12430 [Vibrio anguillarum]
MRVHNKLFYLLPVWISISIFSFGLSIITDNIKFILSVSLSYAVISMLFHTKSLHLVLLNFFVLLFPLDYTIGLLSGESFYPFYNFDEMPLAFFLISLFSASFLCFRMNPQTCHFSKNLEIYESKLILRVLMLLAFIATVSIKGSVALFIGDVGYSTYQENLRGGSGIIEYTLMIFISCLFYKKNKKEYYLLVGLILFYCLKMTLLGFRVQSLISILVITFLVLKKNPSVKVNISICVLGFLFMVVYGIVKEGVNVFEDGFSFNILVDTRYGYIQSHQHGVLSSGSIILSHPNEELLNILYIPATFLASIFPRFLIGTQLEFMYPSIYVQNFEYTPGGGFFSVQMYSLLGIGGVIASLLFLMITFSKFCSANCNKFILVMGITLLCFFPRWISYDFLNFGLRTVLLTFVLVHMPYYFKLSSKC